MTLENFPVGLFVGNTSILEVGKARHRIGGPRVPLAMLLFRRILEPISYSSLLLRAAPVGDFGHRNLIKLLEKLGL